MKLSKAILAHKENSNKSSKGKPNDKHKKQGKTMKPKIANKYKWKTVPPKDNDLTKDVKGHTYHFKMVDNKEYYWCQYHAAWVMHESERDGREGCHLHKQQDSGNTPHNTHNKNSFVNALMSLLED